MKTFNRTGKGRFSSFRSFVRRVWFWTKVSTSAAAFGALFIGIGAVAFKSDKVEAVNTVTVVQTKAPIMERIADCESGGGKKDGRHQFNADGSPVMHVNSNGTTDVGEWQINMNADNIRIEAKMGFNVLTQEGNKAMADWLYANVGTGPWASSADCWRK